MLGKNSIRLDYSYKRKVLKVEAFTSHLGSDEDIRVAFLKVRKHLFSIFLALCDVRVVTGDPGLREQFPEFFLDLFRSGPAAFQSLLSAGMADRGERGLVHAPVAPECVVVAVLAQRTVAVRALYNLSALGALHHRSV